MEHPESLSPSRVANLKGHQSKLRFITVVRYAILIMLIIIR